jgi:hypothetical protein
MVFHLESAAESYGRGGDQGVQVRDHSRPLLEREESVSPHDIVYDCLACFLTVKYNLVLLSQWFYFMKGYSGLLQKIQSFGLLMRE